jgi:hypothetical protein
LFPSIKQSKKFCIFPQQIFSGGDEATGGYDFLQVFAVRFWTLWNEFFRRDATFFSRLAGYFARYMMHLFFFPVIISASLCENRKFRFTSIITFRKCIKVFKSDVFFWILSAPLFVLPKGLRSYFLKIFIPFKILNCLFLSFLISLYSLFYRVRPDNYDGDLILDR